MKHLAFIFYFVLTALWVKGQSAEPAVTGANFIPSSIGVGQTSTLTISFANTGSTPIPANSIELTISTAKNYYTTNGTTPPSGVGGSLFTWTHVMADVWRGVNTNAIPAFGGGDITLQVKGNAVSPSLEITNVNVQPINSFASFNDSPNNNNLQPKLQVTNAVAGEIDLALSKNTNKKIVQLGDTITYTVKVWNNLTAAASGIEVLDSIAIGGQILSASVSASRGTSSVTNNVIKWVIPNIAANGDTVTLTYKMKAIQTGLHFNTAEISKMNGTDKNSTPGNGIDSENDLDRACFTVPFQLCTGEKVEVRIPTKYTNVQWFKDGASTSFATGNVILLTDKGSYTYTANNQSCPSQGCCPIIISDSQNCCPPILCIPVTVLKIKTN